MVKKEQKSNRNYKIGIMSISSKGTGYVKVLDEENNPNVKVLKKQDIKIDFKYLNKALNGDKVEIMLHSNNQDRVNGEVTKILNRAKTSFVGILKKESLNMQNLKQKKKEIFFLKPDDVKMYTNIIIPENMLYSAEVGQKVLAEIITWKDSKEAPLGKIKNIIGKVGENDTEMRAIALEKGFNEKLPEKVEKEAQKIKHIQIKKENYRKRRDFRKTLTFTIDPSDAKDFDDAISFKEIKNNNIPLSEARRFEIGIHVSDVSYYVKIGSELDREAQKRATSVYLVDRTIPMLPMILSNDICSLVPKQDRLTMSAVFIMDEKANIKSQWFGRTVIHSQKKFTYEEAEKSIKKTSALFHKELSILNNLAKKLTKERFSKGALSLDQEEVKFVLGKDGIPLKVIKKNRGDSHRLIEEFMLLANKKVAELISTHPKSIQNGYYSEKKDAFPKKYTKIKNQKKTNNVFVYRVHDLPTKEKMADLAFFLQSLGHKVSVKNGVILSSEINKILETLSSLDNRQAGEKDTVHKAVIRSMQKAIYSTKNIGHYGLAFPYYTHFTSPIRRYPDIMVHRLLWSYLNGEKIKKNKMALYEELSRKSSEQEKKANEAERASIKYKQVEYMSIRIGKNFEGIINGVNERGIYVEEIETKSEGMVKIKDMKDNFYIFNEKRLELIGQGKKSDEKYKERYRLGDKVKIKVKAVDLDRKTIDYILI